MAARPANSTRGQECTFSRSTKDAVSCDIHHTARSKEKYIDSRTESGASLKPSKIVKTDS